MTAEGEIAAPHTPQLRRLWGGPSTLSRIREACAQEGTAIFFAEDRSDWLHIGPLAELVAEMGKPVLRLTGDPNDPMIVDRGAMFIGKIVSATRLFLRLPPSVVVMTMTDLDAYHLKRSVHDVHYVYVFHSLLSTHRAYREHAFDAYDSILCCGPHHKRELEKAGEANDLRRRNLLETGYCRLDAIIAESKNVSDLEEKPTRVLLAPTWGTSSLIEHNLEKIIENLLKKSIEVILRFHPMSLRHQPSLVTQYSTLFGDNPKFSHDPDFESTESLHISDVVLSDWSGAAQEFSLGLLRPAIFVDTPKKTHNSEFLKLGIPCYEDLVRQDLGALVHPTELDLIPELVESLHGDRAIWYQKLERLRNEHLYNPGTAVAAAADYIVRLLS